MEGEGPLRRGGDGKCGTLTLGRVGKGLSLPAAAGVAERERASWGMEWRLETGWGGAAAAVGVCLWLHCLLVFYFVFFCVGPWKGILLGYPSPLGITVKRAVCSFNLVL
jgi:hypothetical protein